MKRTSIAAVLAWAFTAATAAQAPPPAQPSQAPPPAQPSQAQQPRAAAPSQAMTLSGCLYREEQVPGRTPNPAERVGIARKVGSLEKGKLADVLVLDKKLAVKRVFIGGREFQPGQPKDKRK